MKKLFLLFVLSSYSFCYTQCEKEIIEKEDYYYNGCTDYEGSPDGNGYLKLIIKDQIQEFDGVFSNGSFKSGNVSVKFPSGDISLKEYHDYNNEILSSEIYIFSNGNKIQTIYNSGVKTKEIQTFDDIDSKGLIIERVFKKDIILETRNIDNNRVESDIVGEKDYIDIDLINEINKFRIPIEFPTTNGASIKVPILFDTGATTFLIGNKLYQDLLEKCDIVDMQVNGKMNGVGSLIDTKYIKISEVKIGEYIVKNVIAIVPTGNGDDGLGSVNDMLIGIGFLKKFKDVEWSLNKNKMRFYK
tara:strand:+ start:1449 stop:2351 length:903 start_codon:yes stop_codon:yes gene_type:complete